ncbi:MAG: sensor histidine kinase [Puniceicoccaceae bacterium]|nr:MAG: sensor histidine kinase [Puniceicoccaceae bacterium]
MRYALKKENFEIAIAETGEEALVRFEEFQPDLILLDVMLPGIDGYETCRRLHQTHGPEAATVIFLTGKSRPEDVVAGLDAGGVDYLSKPFSPREALARIRTHLSIREQAEKQQALIDQLSRANEAKNRFLGMAAHDLRNPLASVRNLAEFLSDQTLGPLTPDQASLVQTIRETSHGMLGLVNELLDFSAIEAGVLHLNPAPTPLADLVDHAVRLASMEAAKKGTSIRIVAGDDQSTIMADPSKVTQVIDNLLSNAVKYSPPGSEITVEIQSSATGYTLAVSDEGPGIPPAEFDRLFQDYSRLSTKPTGGEKSTGLGLAICRKIIEAHHGEISAENLPGRGCQFRFTLPASS